MPELITLRTHEQADRFSVSTFMANLQPRGDGKNKNSTSNGNKLHGVRSASVWAIANEVKRPKSFETTGYLHLPRVTPVST